MFFLYIIIMDNEEKKPDDIKHITDYMLVETALRPADLCFVFGGQNADHLADHAAKLYHQGLFKHIIVSGGVATDDGRLECDRMRDRLVEKGVPEDCILVENQATNTGENVTYGMQLLEKEIGLDNIGSIIGIGQIHASRRFLMTLEKHWPDVVKMFSTPNYYPVDKKDWHKDEKFRDDVMRVREELEEMRRMYRDQYSLPKYDLFLEKIAKPLAVTTAELQREINERLKDQEVYIADEGSVPYRYEKNVADYFKQLSEAETVQ